MLCVQVLIFAVLIIHLEGHQLEERQAYPMNAEEIVRDLYGWKKESDTKLAALETEIQKLKLVEGRLTQKLENIKLPPLGFIYIQYGGQYSPSALWPGARWTNVSSQYAGAFFRAVGGHSEPFGRNQRESMRTLSFEFLDTSSDRDLRSTDNMPYDSWVKVTSGGRGGSWNRLHVYYHQKGTAYASRDKDNEVRPFNQAVLIWKRTG